MSASMFIKFIKFDDEKRIIIAIQDQFVSYLQKDESKKMLRETLTKVLAEDFKQLEVSKNSCRITVAEGKEDASKVIIEEEIAKAIEMAMMFMSQMNQNPESN